MGPRQSPRRPTGSRKSSKNIVFSYDFVMLRFFEQCGTSSRAEARKGTNLDRFGLHFGSLLGPFSGPFFDLVFEERFETIEGSRKRPEGDPIAICMVLEGSRDPRQSLGRQKP